MLAECKWFDLRNHWNLCKHFEHPIEGPSVDGAGYWQSIGPDKGVQCLLVSLVANA